MPGREDCQPLYFDGPDGMLFAVWYRPLTEKTGTVLYLPPFGEEMNRSRRTIAVLGRAMVDRGLGLFVLDPFGTGDSAGDFEEASWTGWQADAGAAVRFIEAQGHRVAGAMGLRTGALLALACAREHHLKRVMLCQPVESGHAFLTGLLRSRIAGSMLTDGPRVTVDGLRAILAIGSSVEIMGYTISPTLAAELEAAGLATAGTDFSGCVDWLHLTAGPDDSVPQKAADAITRFSAAIPGQVRNRAIAAPSFWLLEEAPPADRFVTAVVDAWLTREAV